VSSVHSSIIAPTYFMSAVSLDKFCLIVIRHKIGVFKLYMISIINLATDVLDDPLTPPC
jgi:hypothetical protein